MMLAAARGQVGYIDESMCVYRKNVKNSWTDSFGKKLKDVEEYRIASITYLRGFDAWTDNTFHEEVESVVKTVNYQYLSALVRCASKSKQLSEFCKLLPFLGILNMIKSGVKIICHPKVYGIARKMGIIRR